MDNQNKFPKVLVGCPINIAKNYCMERWLNMVTNLSYPNYDLYLVDNTEDRGYHKNLRRKHCVKIDYVEPGKKELRFILAECFEKIRQRAVKRNYDYLMLIECDIFPPYQIIELLMAHRKQVVGTSYFTEHGSKTAMQLLYLDSITNKDFVSRYMNFDQVRKFYNGKLNRTFANGNGCILIERSVLEKLTFRVTETETGFPDSFFHKDLFLLGIENYVDTSIIPLHLNSSWDNIKSNIKHAHMWSKIQTNLNNI